MPIYLHVEIAVRELDSKLLLAIAAAERGEVCVLGDFEGLARGLKTGLFRPGVFHTKSLTPSSSKLENHKALLKLGVKITSLDEEGGLVDSSYGKFARTRYSSESISQADLVFCWGRDDFDTLKAIYPEHAEKFVLSGSPRIDLLSPSFSTFWPPYEGKPSKPFLLVSTNFAINKVRRFHERLNFDREAGYLSRDETLLRRRFDEASEDYAMMFAFVEAIESLVAEFPELEIVVRPHPNELFESWQTFLAGIERVSVLREGSIGGWLHGCLGLMHQGCTTALEATVAGKPVITYQPFQRRTERPVPNLMGIQCTSVEELLTAVDRLLQASQTSPPPVTPRALDALDRKIFRDNGFAAERIVDGWEKTLGGFSNGRVSLRMRLFGSINMFRQRFLGSLKSILRLGGGSSDTKFPPLNLSEIRSKLDELARITGRAPEFRAIQLSPTMVVIWK